MVISLCYSLAEWSTSWVVAYCVTVAIIVRYQGKYWLRSCYFYPPVLLKGFCDSCSWKVKYPEFCSIIAVPYKVRNQRLLWWELNGRAIDIKGNCFLRCVTSSDAVSWKRWILVQEALVAFAKHHSYLKKLLFQ
jgi:hypothetical protein